jgi:hypothetical protein
MKINENQSNDKHVTLYYGLTTNQESTVRSKSGFLLDNQTQLELIELNQPIIRGTGYGRTANCCPKSDVELIKNMIENEGYTILIPPMELGGLLDFNKEKVVILQDPDGNEVRFMRENKSFLMLSGIFVLFHQLFLNGKNSYKKVPF